MARWSVMAVGAGVTTIAGENLRRALIAGWEPFAVADGHIWLRKEVEPEPQLMEAPNHARPADPRPAERRHR
jgi:hypothetical protein